MSEPKLSYSPQKGIPGHCLVAQVWLDGKALAEVEPTADEAVASGWARKFAAVDDLLAACRIAADACRKNLAAWSEKYEPPLLDALRATEDAVRKATGGGEEISAKKQADRSGVSPCEECDGTGMLLGHTDGDEPCPQCGTGNTPRGG